MKRAHLVLLLAGALAGAPLMGGAPASAQRPQEAPAATTPKPQSAKTILDAAMRRSAQERKPIFLMFDASW